MRMTRFRRRRVAWRGCAAPLALGGVFTAKTGNWLYLLDVPGQRWMFFLGGLVTSVALTLEFAAWGRRRHYERS